MFDIECAPSDELESVLIAAEAAINRLRFEQLRALRVLDGRQVGSRDGSRSMSEWVGSRLDMAPEAAQRLIGASRLLPQFPPLLYGIEDGVESFDRAVETARLAAAGASRDLIADSRGFDVAGVRRLAAARRRMSRVDEHDGFAQRFFMMQPTLDESSCRLAGRLPGTDAEILQRALDDRADQFPALPDGMQDPRAQRHADALVALAQDSLGANGSPDSQVPLVSVFVDAALAAPTNGEAGVTVGTGVRVGPETLERILCEGKVEVTAVTADGTAFALGTSARTVPPRVRRLVLWRDGGCTAEGCTSRYRLQPHHIVPRSRGGSNDLSNLTTLCWFHHHVVVHGKGYRIDPASPSRRRRFLPRHIHGPDPP
jgi:hypothetical protein